jgi:NAD(P)-dependent dehydrogenase (short-subunit alcohol dehydrogenase family)
MKVAIITGASKGIGASVAEALAVDGYTVVMAARSKDVLKQLADQISSKITGLNAVVAYPLDVQNHEAVQALVSDVVSRFGRIDLLFNNAGVDMLGTTDVSIQDFDKTIAVNLRGAFSMLQAVVPIMKDQGSGTIINVASKAGKIGFENVGVYGASKFGLVGLNESLYRELSPLGIKVTALCPGWVDTDMAKTSGLPGEEMISTEDIVVTVRWLLSLSPAAVVKELVIECRQSIT